MKDDSHVHNLWCILEPINLPTNKVYARNYFGNELFALDVDALVIPEL